MTEGSKEWMVGLPDHPDLLSVKDLLRLIHLGQIRETDLVRRTGDTWHAASDISELQAAFAKGEASSRKTRRRPLKSLPPPEPRKEVPAVISGRPEGSMEGKYYSPTDLLRAVSHGMAPRNLSVSVLFLFPVFSLVFLFSESISNPLLRYSALSLGFGCGISFVTFVLSHISRSQMEGGDVRVGWALGWALRRWWAVLSLPLIVLFPAAFFTGILYLLGIFSSSTESAASIVRSLYFVPVLAGLGLMGCFLFLEFLLMLVPSGMVIENESLRNALRSTRFYLRTQTGRFLFHWLVITVGCAVSYRIISYFIYRGFAFAADITGQALQEGSKLELVYSGLREGLSLAIPVSLFVTMSVLSFLVLREEEMEYLTEEEMGEADETHPSTQD
ncbi:MAG: hypothetical protein QF645_06100 [Planctomycetota bacterium]|nr:hypothetical protein [Planctomycetota bacterium]